MSNPQRAFVSTSIGLLLGLSALVLTSDASASERRMTYTYGTNVLPRGGIELEPWTTVRLQHHGYYFGLDHRLEFEVGVTDAVQTAVYLNLSTTAEDVRLADRTTEREHEFEWQGLSWEWKFKFLDSVADPVGIGLYFEPTISTTEGELEAKLLLDKRVGNFYFAWNPVFEYEAEFATQDVEHELKIENDVGLLGFLRDDVTVGVEIRNLTTLVEGGSELESSVFWAGPVVSFSQPSWWTAMSVMPQIGAVKGDATAAETDGSGHVNDGPFELVHAERLNIRLLFGYTI